MTRKQVREPVVVAAGILTDAQDRILIAERPDGKHLAGTWEFPGGKLEAGEDAAAALTREIEEEIGVAVHASKPLLTLTHRYPEKTVRLMIRTITRWSGRPEGREGQALRWIERDELSGLHMPAGNRPIARALELSPYMTISPAPENFPGTDAFLTDWTRRAEQGYLLQLRAYKPPPGLPLLRRGRGSTPPPGAREAGFRERSGGGPTLLELATECGQIARQAGARWLLNGPPQMAQAAGADGVHLAGWRLKQLPERPPGDGFIVSAACHSLEDIHLAAEFEVDLVTFSPIRNTASHPDTPGIGFDALARVCDRSPLPVYALGGMKPDDLEHARRAGAFGVAGIRAFA